MSASQNTPTYVMLTLYLLLMIIVTIIANRQNARATTQSKSNLVNTHFLASKSFGAVVLLLTTFASVFSGYTVVGVPNEAGFNGFTAIRWIGGTGFVSVGFAIIFPRLRRISMEREYLSPGDFIYDRYRSKIVRVLTTLCLCVPQLLYIGVQLHALGATLVFFTNKELEFNTVVVVSALLILVLEALGGLRTVAYTDVVQATVMIIIFICLPIVLAVMYHGGFIGQVVNSDELPCANDRSYTNDEGHLVESGCLNYMRGPAVSGSEVIIADEFYLRSPSSLTIINYVLFSVSLLSFVLNPHVVQRAMAAKHDWQLRFVMIVMSITPYICQFPGVFIGISYLSNWKSLTGLLSYYPAFQSTLGLFVEEGGFKEVLGYIAMLAAVAGIMSTADSALIGVSNTFVCDLFQNWLTPNISARYIVWIGKTVSLVTVCIAIALAIDLQNKAIANSEPVNYGVLLTIQQGILWQAFPAFSFGLYTNISWKSIASGLCLGIAMEIILVSLVFSERNPFIASNAAFEKLDASWSVLCGVALNLVVCAIAHCIFGGDNHKAHDDESEDVLTIHRIKEIMKGINEPMTKYYGVFVWLTAAILLITAFHWIDEIDPALIDIYGSDGVKQLLYNGYVRNVISGLPDWVFATMIWYAIATLLSMCAAFIWNTDAVHEGRIFIADRSGAELERQPITTSCVVLDDNNDDTQALNAYHNKETHAITEITKV